MIYNLEIALDELKREGEREGKREGKREREREVAKNLLLLNVDVDTIAKATGLTLEEIEALGRQLQN